MKIRSCKGNVLWINQQQQIKSWGAKVREKLRSVGIEEQDWNMAMTNQRIKILKKIEEWGYKSLIMNSRCTIKRHCSCRYSQN